MRKRGDKWEAGGTWGKVHLGPLMAIAPNMTAAVVYAYLCCRANTRGEAWPDDPTIAVDLGVSVVTVRRALRILLDEEAIERGGRRFVIPELVR